ncbi:MAG TPA: winged helix-turn-helix domain-containing protein [Terracidiphilus sp.]|nr:winged helix-turn-helix domain-containing protein [Terracidiphilus sp.]
MRGPTYQFADFQLDCSRFELLRNGRALRVERKPMELLILLASRQGQLVSRTEIAQHLWSSEVFVDTEHGINTAIRKLRHLLRDDSEDPQFIQTVTGMGYRFIAPTVSIAEPATDSPAVPTLEPAPADGITAPEAPTPPLHESPKKPLAVQVAVIARFVALTVLFIVMAIGPRKIADLLHRDPNPPITSLAVIPLDNLSGDPNQEYFADGMTDELTTMLAKNSTLRIVSRTSAMQYKAAHRPLPEIARALNVDAILEGSVSRANGQVHMTLQLIRADTDAHLWAESYDRSTNDVAALPSEAAQAIARRLHSDVAMPATTHAVSPEAHDAYLRGRYFLQKREPEKSSAYFQQATSIDPSLSQAYSGLAAAVQIEGVFGTIRPQDAMTRSDAAARRAIELDPDNGEAYSALGLTQAIFEWSWSDAEENLKRGIALSPNSSDAELNFAVYLDAVNRPEEAVTHMRRALEIEPGSFIINRHLGSTLFFARHYDEALIHLQQALEMEPGKRNFVAGWASRIYEMKGMRDKAVESDAFEVGMETSDAKASGILAIYKRDGWKAYWEARMKILLARQNEPCVPYDIGVNYIRLGKPDLAFSRINAAIDQKCWESNWMMVDPALDSIRSDGQYSDLLKRMNLPH